MCIRDRSICACGFLRICQFYSISKLYRAKIANGNVDIPDKIFLCIFLLWVVFQSIAVSAVFFLSKAIGVFSYLFNGQNLFSFFDEHAFHIYKVKIVFYAIPFAFAHFIHDAGTGIQKVIDLSLIHILEPLMPWLLSFAAGAMLYVVVEELIPEAHLGEHSHVGTLGVMGGFLVMMILDVALG